MSYIGTIGAGRLDKSNSSVDLLSAQKMAVSMFCKGMDMRIIKQQTGWETGIDGKWRYEIEDPFHTTAEIEDHVKRHFGEPINIRFCMADTRMLVAYPSLERLKLFAKYTQTGQFAGYFNPANYGMMICMGTADSPFDLQTEGVLLHEIQHLIQEEENFARGGSSQNLSRYLRLAGEVEARNICFRHPLNCEQRRNKLRTDTQDIPDQNQIIVFR